MRVGFMVRCECGNQQVIEIKPHQKEFDITESFDSPLFTTLRNYVDYLDIICNKCGHVAIITI